MSEQMNEAPAKTRKPRGPAAAHTVGSLDKTLSLLGIDRFAAVAKEHSDDPVFQKALAMLGRKRPEAAALLGVRESGTVSAARGLFVTTAAIGAGPGDKVSVKVEDGAIVIRKA